MTDQVPALITPAATPTAPASVTPTTPTPGWKTSEAWITFLAMLIGLIPSSGLVDNAPLAAKIVGMAIAALSAFGYTTNRTSLKRAHLSLAAGQIGNMPASLTTTKATAIGASALALVLGLGYAVNSNASATTTESNAIAGAPRASMHAITSRSMPAPSNDDIGVDAATVRRQMAARRDGGVQ